MEPRARSRAQAAYGWVRERPVIVDTLIALGFAIITTRSAGLFGDGPTYLGLIMVAPLAGRRVWPVTATTLVAVGALVHVALVDVPQVAALAVPFALFSVVGYGPRRAIAPFVALAVAGAVLAGWRWGGPDRVSIVVVAGGCLVAIMAAVAAGQVRVFGRRHEADVVERARSAEAERAQQARLAAAGERARIAREMHDVVAHSLAVMIAQADGARYVVATDADAADGALRTVAATGRTALADMRGLLGVLRDGATTGSLPQPGIGEIEALVEAVRSSGTRVTLTTTGTRPADLPPAWQLTAYRIVQESLTNVLKHAGAGSRARVSQRWHDDGLRLEIMDEGGAGPVAADVADGLGIEGMRQRVATHDGTLRVGPRAGGGWQVDAELPYPTPVSRPAA